MFGDPGGGLAALEAFQRDYLSPSSRADPSPSLVGSSPVSGLGTPGSLGSLGTQGTPGTLSSLPPTPPRANSSSPAASLQPGSGSFEEQFKEVLLKVQSSLHKSKGVPKQYETELKND